MRAAKTRGVDITSGDGHVVGDDAIVLREQECDPAGQAWIDAEDARGATRDHLDRVAAEGRRASWRRQNLKRGQRRVSCRIEPAGERLINPGGRTSAVVCAPQAPRAHESGCVDRVDRCGSGDALAALGDGRAAALAAGVSRNVRGFDGGRGGALAGQKRDARARVLGRDIIGFADTRELELALFDQLVAVNGTNPGPGTELGLEAQGAPEASLSGMLTGTCATSQSPV